MKAVKILLKSIIFLLIFEIVSCENSKNKEIISTSIFADTNNQFIDDIQEINLRKEQWLEVVDYKE